MPFLCALLPPNHTHAHVQNRHHIPSLSPPLQLLRYNADNLGRPENLWEQYLFQTL